MDPLEKSLVELKEVEPDAYWVREAKEYVMHRVQLWEDETVVQAWFERAGAPVPRLSFLQAARTRLMSQIQLTQVRWGETFFGFKRLLASALVLVLAVTMTSILTPEDALVEADGRVPVLKVLSGEVRMQENLTWDKVTGGWKQMKEGDLLRTNTDVDAVIDFNDNQLRLGPNTVLLVTQLNDKGEIRFSVSQGQAWLYVPSQKQQKNFVSLETPNASVLTPNASVFVQVGPLGASTTVQVFDGAARVTHVNPATQETKVEVMSAHEALTVYGKKPSEGVTDFDVKQAKEDPNVMLNLQRDELQRENLKRQDLERLKRMLSE